jgi:hypothetical protein
MHNINDCLNGSGWGVRAALDARVMEILRSELGKGRLYMADIREEQARCMGFKG